MHQKILQTREPEEGSNNPANPVSPTSLMHLLSCPKSKFKHFSKSCKVSLAADEIYLLQMCTLQRTLWQEVVPNLVLSTSHPQSHNMTPKRPKRKPGDLQIDHRDATNVFNGCNAL